jgi:hypothetical protein
MQVTTMATLGLNDADPRFQDFTGLSLFRLYLTILIDTQVFLTAAGYSGASAQYALPDPPFVYDKWTVAPFSVLPFYLRCMCRF